MSKAFIKLTNTFADETTRDLEMGPFNPAKLDKEEIRTKVKNFDASKVAGIYVSESGANFTKISAASIIVTDEREIV